MLLSLFLILTFIVTPEVPIKNLLHLKNCGDEKIGGGGGMMYTDFPGWFAPYVGSKEWALC